MRALFSEHERRKLWRAVWIALAESQVKSGLVTPEELADLRAHGEDIDIDAALKIEREIGHDLMAEIRVYASQATIGGGKIHLGATSMDIEDTVETFRLRRGLALLLASVDELLAAFVPQIERYADVVCMGYTHLQPAEPTTVGYRLAVYAQDVLIDRAALAFAGTQLTAKGIRGAVGTSASYTRLLDGGARTPEQQEADVLGVFELEARDVATQTYPRKLDYTAALAAGRPRRVALEVRGRRAHPELARFRRDVRAVRREASRQLGDALQAQSGDVGAHRFARPAAARHTPTSRGRTRRRTSSSARSTTARTGARFCRKRCSAPTRSSTLARKIVDGLRIDERKITENLRTYGPFAGSEAVLMEAARAGGDRQELHEAIRENAMAAYEALERGETNPLSQLLAGDERIVRFVDPAEVRSQLDPAHPRRRCAGARAPARRSASAPRSESNEP